MHVPLRQSCVCLFLSDWVFAGRVLLDVQRDILIASISGGRIRLFGESQQRTVRFHQHPCLIPTKFLSVSVEHHT